MCARFVVSNEWVTNAKDAFFSREQLNHLHVTVIEN